jgi:hypothetical protein
MNRNTYRTAFVCAVFLSALALGGLAGTATGNFLITRLLTRGMRLGLLFYKPAFHFFVTGRLLDSPDETRRLEGYYSLLDSGRVEVPYLIERYRLESSIHVKRTIVWIMGYAADRDAAFDALSSLHRDAAPSVKKEAERSLKRLDTEEAREFLKSRTGKARGRTDH